MTPTSPPAGESPASPATSSGATAVSSSELSAQSSAGSPPRAVDAPTGPTAPEQNLSNAPLGALVHRLSEQIPELVRSEIRLAQAELTQKGKTAGIGIGLFSAAGLVALYGLAALLSTLVIVLDLFLPLWLAALIVTLLLFVIAAVVALMGKKQVSEVGPATPEKAIAGVKEDVATIKGEHT